MPIAVTRTSQREVFKEKFFDGVGARLCEHHRHHYSPYSARVRARLRRDRYFRQLPRMPTEVAQIEPCFRGLISWPLPAAVPGDAATFAFNEAVTPRTTQFGMSIDSLGYLAAISGHSGRLSSPFMTDADHRLAGLTGVRPLNQDQTHGSRVHLLDQGCTSLG